MNNRVKRAQAKTIPFWAMEIGRGFHLQVVAEVNDTEMIVVIATPSKTTYGVGTLTGTEFQQSENSAVLNLVGKDELSVALEELKKWAIARSVMMM